MFSQVADKFIRGIKRDPVLYDLWKSFCYNFLLWLLCVCVCLCVCEDEEEDDDDSEGRVLVVVEVGEDKQ